MQLLVLSALAAPPWSELGASGWEEQATSKTEEAGTVTISVKFIEGTHCVRGAATFAAGADTLYAVVSDAPAAKSFSSETLLEAEQLGAKGNTLDYYQHLDVPGWTMAADRYWVLRGENVSSGDVKSFRWSRFDWRSEYPDLAKRIDTEHSGAVEPVPNFGSWVFEPGAEGTKATYTLCSDPGGSLPKWVQKTAATKSLPNTMVDVVREAKRREAL